MPILPYDAPSFGRRRDKKGPLAMSALTFMCLSFLRRWAAVTGVTFFSLAFAISSTICFSSTSATARPFLTLNPTLGLTWITTPAPSVPETVEVTLRAQIWSRHQIKTQHIMINVEDANNRPFPTAIIANATIGRRGLTLSAIRRFPPGSYRYRIGYMKDNRWTNVGVLRNFTVTTTKHTNPNRAASVSGRWVMGYYVGYMKDSYPLNVVEWDAMTHVAVGAAIPRPDGTLDTNFYQDPQLGPAWAKSVVDRSHENGRKAILMLGGAHSRDVFVSATSSGNRRRFVDAIVRTVNSLGFDGVDVDWEPMVAEDAPRVLALGRDLKASRPGLLLTLPVSAVNINDPQGTVFPLMTELASVYDQLNIMSYGMNGGWRGWKSWHNGALYGETQSTPMSVDSSVRAYLTAGVPSKKIGIGIGFFGSCMTGVSEPRQLTSTMTTVAEDNVMSFTNIMMKYHRPDLARWDDVAKVPYLSSGTPVGPAGCTYVTYENQRSIAEKANYVKSKGLGGTIIWNINQGHIAEHLTSAPLTARSLMRAIRIGFLD